MVTEKVIFFYCRVKKCYFLQYSRCDLLSPHTPVVLELRLSFSPLLAMRLELLSASFSNRFPQDIVLILNSRADYSREHEKLTHWYEVQWSEARCSLLEKKLANVISIMKLCKWVAVDRFNTLSHFPKFCGSRALSSGMNVLVVTVTHLGPTRKSFRNI